MELDKKVLEFTSDDGVLYENQELANFIENFAIRFSEWLIKKCDFQKHGVWLYKGMEMTQKELLEVFKHYVE